MIQYVYITYGEITYQLFNNGNIYNLKGNQLTPYISNTGYYRIGLGKAKYRKNYSIHRLVAQYFVDNPNNYDMIDHIDNNRLNNNYDNLQWVTAKENTIKAHNDGLIDYTKYQGENNHESFLTESIIREMRKLYQNGMRICDISMKIFGNKNKSNTNNISLIVHYKRWKHII